MITVYTNGNLSLDGKDTGLGVVQRKEGTEVFVRETLGTKYRKIVMPHARYSLAHNAPASRVPGRTQFEDDVRAALGALRQ